MQGSLTPSFSLLAKAALLFTLPRTSNHDVLSPPTPTWQHSTGVAYPIDLYCNDVTTSLTVTDEGKHFRICHSKTEAEATLTLVSHSATSLEVESDHQRSRVCFAKTDDILFIDDGLGHFAFTCVTHSKAVNQTKQGTAQVNAVMDGVIVALLVEQGDAVSAGDTVAIMEAMKMEHPLKATMNGIVQLNAIETGDQVKSKQVIATILQADEVTHEQK